METSGEQSGVEKQARIVEFLREKYNPQAIILYGSRARGTSRQLSDWDIYVLVSEGKERSNHTLAPFEGEHLDVDLAVLPIEDENILNRLGTTLLQAKILFDPKGIGDDLIKRAGKIYEKGIQISEAQVESRKNFFLRMIAKLEDNVDNEGVFFYRLGTFYPYAIRYWFELQKEWAPAPREALPVIEARDPDFYKRLTVLSSGASLPEKLTAAKEVFSHLFTRS